MASSFAKRAFGLIVFIALLTGLAPASAFAYEDEDGFQYDGVDVVALSNTFSDDAGGGSILDPDAGPAIECDTVDQAVDRLRTSMANREATISLMLETDANYKQLALGMFYAALEEDGVSWHGDYLRYVWANMSCQMKYRTSEQGYRVTYTYAITYKTTGDLERALAERLQSTLAGMQLAGKTDYQKIKAIYDYICTNVSYDYNHLGDPSYKLHHTAYAALFHGRAVCQGYASLFYLMAGEAGLDTRIVSGDGSGKDHSWNIVKLGNVWYNLDTTWDVERKQAGQGYAYFLKSDGDFRSHTRGTHGETAAYAVDYASSAFYAAHPMASTSYGSTGAWKHDSNGWWYQRANGTFPVSCWEQIDGSWYLFDSAGYMRTGWVNLSGKWRYLGSDGAMRTGWLYDGAWYYLDPANDGIMVTGWKQIDGSWYYFNGSGIMQTNWLNLSGKWRYLGTDGAMRTGWAVVDGSRYYLDPANDGIMVTGWKQIDGSRYYFNSSGVMASNCWAGDYYLLSDGRMATNQWIGEYYVGPDGKWIPNYSEQA